MNKDVFKGFLFAIIVILVFTAQSKWLANVGNRMTFYKGFNISASADSVGYWQGMRIKSIALDTGTVGSSYDSILVIIKNGSTADYDTLWWGLDNG